MRSCSENRKIVFRVDDRQKPRLTEGPPTSPVRPSIGKLWWSRSLWKGIRRNSRRLSENSRRISWQSTPRANSPTRF